MGVPMNMRWTVIAAATALGAEGVGSAFLGPGADLAVITAAWVAMILTLAAQAGVSLERDKALKLVTALLVSLGSFVGGSKLAIQAFSYTGIGTPLAMLANLGINAVVTYVVGMAIAQLFVQDKKIDSIEAFAASVVAAALAALGLGGPTAT